MAHVALPNDAKAGPTKAEVRAVLLDKFALGPEDHFVEVGSCTGAVTIMAARRAGRVTALERKPDRLAVTRDNLAANGFEATASGAAVASDGRGSLATGTDPAIDLGGDHDPNVVLVEAEAPEGLPDDADALFVGGSRNYREILDHAVETGVGRVIMNVSRLEVAGDATRAFRERDILDEVIQFQVSHGYELAGATSFDSDNPVYMLVGGVDETDGADDGGGGE